MLSEAIITGLYSQTMLAHHNFAPTADYLEDKYGEQNLGFSASAKANQLRDTHLALSTLLVM